MPADRDEPPLVESLNEIARAFFGAMQQTADRLVRAVPEAVRTTLADPELRAQLLEEIREVGERLRREVEAYERDPYAFFYDWMLAGHAYGARRLVGIEEETLLAGLEAAFDDDLVDRTVRAVQEAPHLATVHRERLVAGLQALRARGSGNHWAEASDRLFPGLEGALWRAAEATGVVAPGGHHLVGHPRHRRVSGHSGLLDADHGLRMGTSVRRFLHFGLFAKGHDVRHGRAATGYRKFSLLAASGVLGWLATYGNKDPYDELITRLDAWFGSLLEWAAAELD